MRRILITILTGSVSLIALSQEGPNVKEMVGFGCYFASQPTKAVVSVTKLLEAKKYKEVSSKLSSKNTGERYLAVISLQRLSEIGKYQLNDTEKSLISKARLSKEWVSICSGCTLFDKVRLKEMLAPRSFIGSKYWLDGVIGTE